MNPNFLDMWNPFISFLRPKGFKNLSIRWPKSQIIIGSCLGSNTTRFQEILGKADGLRVNPTHSQKKKTDIQTQARVYIVNFNLLFLYQIILFVILNICFDTGKFIIKFYMGIIKLYSKIIYYHICCVKIL